jgi:hypothetical protein
MKVYHKLVILTICVEEYYNFKEIREKMIRFLKIVKGIVSRDWGML